MPLGEVGVREALFWEVGLVGLYDEAWLGIRFGTPAWPGGLRSEVEYRCGLEAPGTLLKCWYRPCGPADWIASQCWFSGTDEAGLWLSVPFIEPFCIEVSARLTGLTFSQSPIKLGAGPTPRGVMALL